VQLTKDRKEPRMPDLELDSEASANVRRILARPSDPTAASEHVARGEKAIRERRARASNREAVAH
jgi:hypothetical protein